MARTSTQTETSIVKRKSGHEDPVQLARLDFQEIGAWLRNAQDTRSQVVGWVSDSMEAQRTGGAIDARADDRLPHRVRECEQFAGCDLFGKGRAKQQIVWALANPGKSGNVAISACSSERRRPESSAAILAVIVRRSSDFTTENTEKDFIQ